MTYQSRCKFSTPIHLYRLKDSASAMPLPNFPQMLLFRKGYLAIEAVLEKVIFSLFSQFRLVLFSSCPKSGKPPINGE
jgi:hypothetical protein